MSSRTSADSGPPFEAVLFDMDGVVTRTAELHAAAWKELFDAFLRRRAERRGEPFRPFDAEADYRSYVDGKPREAGVRSFLGARGIELPDGDRTDGADADTIRGLAERKDVAFDRRLEEQGVEVYPSTMSMIDALRRAGTKIGVVTSSRHGREILARAGIENLFDARIDGIDADERGLLGKPNPDAFVACASILAVTPVRSVVVEDAAAGVAAGRAGGFGLVVGVDRGGSRSALERHGAHIVVEDLAELDVAALGRHFQTARERASWRIEQEGFDPARERGVESLFTVGNGYLAVRGALDTPVPASQGDLFVAGVYDRKQPSRPYSEHEFLDPNRGDYPYSEIVSFPFPFRVSVAVDGRALSLAEQRWREHRRVLDMKAGVLSSETVYETRSGLFATIRTRRCASLADMHLMVQELTVRLDNFSGILEADTSTEIADLAEYHPHLVPRSPRIRDDGIEMRCFTTQASGIEACIASRTTMVGSERERTRWRVSAEIGKPLTLRRYVVVYTSRDVEDPESAAFAAVKGLSWERFEEAFAAHADVWGRIWDRADIHVPDRPAAEQALRFHAYHLSSAADRDPRISVGARALTGRSYEGHIFWDVEVFMLPFYLHNLPDVARCLLSYRHYTLDGARRRAREQGMRGASYAWESTVTGDDVTPRAIVLKTTRKEIPIFTGTQQIHVTADVAYGVWRYWEATRDRNFLRGPGAEILAETARFWVSRAVLDTGAYHIRGVVGPDEYHHGVNDNAYTNYMARFNLERAAWAFQWLHREHPESLAALAERIDLGDDEAEEWIETARRLYVPEPNEDGIIEQFEGFFGLRDYPLASEERLKAPINRLFDWEEINGLKLLKQADVLMLPFLFPEAFSQDVVAANYRYYEPMTDHGSSLSPGVHAALAARLGLNAHARRYWQQSLMLDLSNVMGNSTLGLHAACMGATWQALVFHFLGVRFTDDGPAVDPGAADRLPAPWQSVTLDLIWRDRSYRVEVTR